MTKEIIVWIDGSCGRDGKMAAWGAVIQWPNGSLECASGALGKGVGATDAEILALWHVLDVVDADAFLTIHSDCKALMEALSGEIVEIKSTAWAALTDKLDARPGDLGGRWRKRKSSRGMITAHHLANAARLVAEMAEMPATPASTRVFSAPVCAA